jgi:Flp pilus assembly protein TadD
MTFIARNVLVGRAAMLEGRLVEAATAFAQAAEMEEGEDFKSVADPPAWYYPIRRDLAAALLQSNDLVGARREAEAALKFRPRDPGTLALISTLETRTAAR